jgi:hypothetical protein
MIAPRGVRIGRHGPMVNSIARRVARNGVETAPDYEEPIDDDPIEPPAGEPEPPTDTPPDADNDNEPEPGFDADYVAPARIDIVEDKQTVVRTSTDPGTWGNAYVASALTGPEYWEVEVAASTPNNATLAVGVSTLAMPLNGIPGELAGTIAYWSDGRVRQNGATLMTLATYGRKDRIGVSYDADGGVRLFKNCAPLNGGDAVGTLTTSPRYPFVGLYSTNSRTAFRFALSRFGCALPDEFFPIGQVPVPEIIPIFRSSQLWDINFPSGTLTRASPSMDFGPESATRLLVATIGYSTNSGVAREIGGVSIGGVTATRARRTLSGTQINNSEIWYAEVPNGVSGSVAVTMTQTVAGVNFHLGVYRLDGLAASTPTNTAGAQTNTLNIDCNAGGVVIGVISIQNSTLSLTLTGIDSNNEVNGSTASLTSNTAHREFESTGTKTVSHSGSTNWRMALASWA